MKIRVEYDPTPIRHIAVQCPKCEHWFHGRDITDDKLEYEYKVTIDDSVSMNEFLDKYEILDQEGKIYTVKERE